ncbi:MULTISPECIES: hypothetical protein [unclassified Novosphingobium]|uniref:hypothetical protein n=1 Tax=unclassified Novosphingobium TaxID=2644732 RepID=UPI0025EDDCD2|nr:MULTISPECIES: hypothetical protein [unclassified Novosphingobium]HQV02175.1 hypothetical protein [Novosphingobium sp.]
MTDPEDLARFEQLLPFYVNGTLDDAARSQIDAALPGSPALQRALAEVRALSVQLNDKMQQELAASDAGLAARHAALNARLAAISAVPRPAARSERLTQALVFINPQRWSPSISLSLALAIAAGGGWIAGGGIRNSGDNAYQTASGCDEASKSGSARLVIRFKDDAAWTDVETLLSDHQVAIVAGPDEGRLILLIDEPSTKPDQVKARLARSPIVAFVGELK